MKIEATVAVYVTWNDAANEWEMHPCMTMGGALDWAGEDGVPRWDDRSSDPELSRAADHPVTTEDLAHMLRSGLVATVREANANVAYRAAGPGLVHMLDDAIKVSVPTSTTSERGHLIRNLLPIISSVDENAHQRGAYEARAGNIITDEVQQ